MLNPSYCKSQWNPMLNPSRNPMLHPIGIPVESHLNPIPIDTFLVGWTSIYQLFWGSLGTRVLTHPHIPSEISLKSHWTRSPIFRLCWLHLLRPRLRRPQRGAVLLPAPCHPVAAELPPRHVSFGAGSHDAERMLLPGGDDDGSVVQPVMISPVMISHVKKSWRHHPFLLRIRWISCENRKTTASTQVKISIFCLDSPYLCISDDICSPRWAGPSMAPSPPPAAHSVAWWVATSPSE